mgnify:CR=1 FL=1
MGAQEQVGVDGAGAQVAVQCEPGRPRVELARRFEVDKPAGSDSRRGSGRGCRRGATAATILSATMMLDWLAQRHGDAALSDGARAIEASLAAAFATGRVRPREFGGSSGTADIVRAVIEGL